VIYPVHYLLRRIQIRIFSNFNLQHSINGIEVGGFVRAMD